MKYNSVWRDYDKLWQIPDFADEVRYEQVGEGGRLNAELGLAGIGGESSTSRQEIGRGNASKN